MSLIPAKCTECGANIEVDESKEAGICSHCGTAFVTEKVINNYQTTNNNTNYIGEQTNIYFGESKFEEEKNQCKVLLMLLNSIDLEFLKDRALKVMDLNPDNNLARMIYECDFNVYFYEGYPFLEFNEKPILQYFISESGNVDAETSATFLRMLCLKIGTYDVNNIVGEVFNNIKKLKISEEEKKETYKTMSLIIKDTKRIDELKRDRTNLRLSTLTYLLRRDSYSAQNDFADSLKVGSILKSLKRTRKIIAQNFVNEIKKTELNENVKSEIYRNLSRLATVNISTENNNESSIKNTNQVTNKTEDEEKTSKFGVVTLIVLVGALIIAMIASL